jgi:hypothetical protein
MTATFNKSPRVIIYCMAVAEKWNNYLGVSKYLVPFHKTTLLERTVRLVRKYSSDIVVVSWDERLKVDDVSFHQMPADTLCFAETAWKTKHLWGEETIWLKGDVFFTKSAIGRIISNNDNIRAFGRMYGNMYTSRKDGEMFGFNFKKNAHAEMERAIQIALKDAQNGGRGRMWQIYRALAGIPLSQHSFVPQFLEQITDLTDDIDLPEEYQRVKTIFEWSEQPSLVSKVHLYWFIFSVKVRARLDKIRRNLQSHE